MRLEGSGLPEIVCVVGEVELWQRLDFRVASAVPHGLRFVGQVLGIVHNDRRLVNARPLKFMQHRDGHRLASTAAALLWARHKGVHVFAHSTEHTRR